MPNNFAHIHSHSYFSFQDGVASPAQMVEYAKKMGFAASFITDHGNLFSTIHHYEECKKHEIKCGIGVEGYVSKDLVKGSGKREKLGHIVLVAKNDVGIQNLNRIVSNSYENFYYKPRMSMGFISKYSEGLICSTACIHGLVARELTASDSNTLDGAVSIIKQLMSIFKDDLYLELMETGVDGQKQYNNILLNFAEQFKIKPIITNDVHYLRKEDAEVQDLLISLQNGTHILDRKRLMVYGAFPNDASKAAVLNAEYYMKSRGELEKFADYVPKNCFDNVLEICDKIQPYNMKFDMGRYMPSLPAQYLPVDMKDNDEYLRYLAFQGLKDRGVDTNIYRERLEHELSVIKDLNFSSYFLILAILCKEVRRRGILIGPGRGSAGGALALFSLGISNIDPVKYKLLFERFLNPSRIDLPDVDIDFEQRRRPEVVEIAQQMFGIDKVSKLATFNNLTTKLTIREAIRGIEPDKGRVEELIKSLGDLEEIEPKETFTTTAQREEEPIVRAMNKMKSERSPRPGKTWYDFAMAISGSPKSVGIHASGIVISSDSFDGIVPTFRVNQDSETALMLDMYAASKVGLVKFDILGLTTLDIIKITCEMIEKNHSIKVDPYDIPLDDKKTYEILCDGNTHRIFQAEGAGFTAMFKHLKPECLEDIIAMNALYRPGALAYDPVTKMSMADKYIKTKNKEMTPAPIDPMVDDVLESTHYMMLFQEQIMEVSRRVAGYTLAEADNLRKIIGKKLVDKIEEEGVKFVEHAVNRGVKREFAEYIYSLIKPAGRYAWNRSHSAAYGMITYITAYLKANYPVEFMCANLMMADTKQQKSIIDDCRINKIPVNRPNINKSDVEYTARDGAIYIGISSIKGVGLGDSNNIIKEREENGPYSGVVDFINRNKSLPSNRIAQLVHSGAFDFDSAYNRREIIENISVIKSQIKSRSISSKTAKDRMDTAPEWEQNAYKNALEIGSGKFDLPPSLDMLPKFQRLPEYEPSEIVAFEHDAIGLLDVDSLMDKYQNLAHLVGATTVDNALSLPSGSRVYIYCVNNQVSVIYPKKGQKWKKFGTVDVIDRTGSKERVININTEDLDDKIIAGVNYGCIKRSLSNKYMPVILMGQTKFSVKRGPTITLIDKPLSPHHGVKVYGLCFRIKPNKLQDILLKKALGKECDALDILTPKMADDIISIMGYNNAYVEVRS